MQRLKVPIPKGKKKDPLAELEKDDDENINIDEIDEPKQIQKVRMSHVKQQRHEHEDEKVVTKPKKVSQEKEMLKSEVVEDFTSKDPLALCEERRKNFVNAFEYC